MWERSNPHELVQYYCIVIPLHRLHHIAQWFWLYNTFFHLENQMIQESPKISAQLCIALLFSLRQIFYFSGHCMTHKPMLINVIVVSSSLVQFSSMFINASLIREITILPHISVIWKLPPNYIIVVVTIITCAVDLSRLQIFILYKTNLRFLNIFLLTDDWDRWKWFLSGLLKVC